MYNIVKDVYRDMRRQKKRELLLLLLVLCDMTPMTHRSLFLIKDKCQYSVLNLQLFLPIKMNHECFLMRYLYDIVYSIQVLFVFRKNV